MRIYRCRGVVPWACFEIYHMIYLKTRPWHHSARSIRLNSRQRNHKKCKGTLIPVYNYHKPVLLGLCFKFATSHKNISPSMPTWLVSALSLVKNNSKLTKLSNVCWNHVLFILFRSSYFQQMLNNFVNFDFSFTKLSGSYPCEKRMIPDGTFFMACSKLEAMTIYLVKQACVYGCGFVCKTVYIQALPPWGGEVHEIWRSWIT